MVNGAKRMQYMGLIIAHFICLIMAKSSDVVCVIIKSHFSDIKILMAYVTGAKND